MGSSTDSLTNLASGSDLGKYMPLSGHPSPSKLNTLGNTFDNRHGISHMGTNSIEQQRIHTQPAQEGRDGDFEDIKFFNNKNRRDNVRNLKKGPRKVDNLTFTVSDHMNLGIMSPDRLANYPPIEPILNAKNVTSKSVAREPY